MTLDRPHMLTITACALAALGVWFAGTAVITAVVEPTEKVVVFGYTPQTALGAVLRSDAAPLGGSGRMLTAAGTAPGFVRQLYAAGAWLVLPVSDAGCRGIARLWGEPRRVNAGA
jgi:hypothetical protein